MIKDKSDTEKEIEELGKCTRSTSISMSVQLECEEYDYPLWG